MRFLYLLLKIVTNYSLRIYYPRIFKINSPKAYFGRTIYVSNHPSSFMDPIVIGGLQRPSVFFMTRSDVFTPLMKPILWLAQMLPIYRQLDGEGALSKNNEVFRSCATVLIRGRNLLIFGEGFTDDVFIRRIKPIKKGAARIGFGALESMKWKKKVYLAAIGINYGDPQYLQSDLVISNSARICLNDYKDLFIENPNRAIVEVTKQIESLLKAQLVHIDNADWEPFHAMILRLRRNGLHPVNTDFNISLLQRFENTKQLALWLNKQDLNSPSLICLNESLKSYFDHLTQLNIKEEYVYEYAKKGKLSLFKPLLFLFFTWPFFILGIIHLSLPYLFVKKFTEAKFKRAVFWSSVKMVLGMLVMTLFNWPIMILLNKLFFHSAYISWMYFLILPIVGLITYLFIRNLSDLLSRRMTSIGMLNPLVRQRKELIELINQHLSTL